MLITDAIDDYLRLIVRTRPWTKAREEEILTPFGTWMYEQADLALELDAISPAIVQRYVAHAGLSDDEHTDLDRTLGKVLLWAESRGFVRRNPFMRLAA
jgi:hypothetical protein